MRTPRAWIGWHDRKRLKTALLVLALLFQGYIGQAHFHDLASVDHGHPLIADSGAPGPAGNAADLPANRPDGHNADCAICHLTGLANASLPSQIGAALPPPFRSPLVRPDGATPWLVRAENHSPRGPPITFVQS